jgi:acyl-CoA thioesterase I
MGDSLSAAYGIPLEAGWVKLLERRLQARGYPHRVINGSISGETTAGGLARLPAALDAHQPQLVLVELGGNDGLRGLPAAQVRANLTAMVELTRARGAQPVLFEMRLPPNYGPAYIEAFSATFADVARAQRAPLVPFFLVREPGAFQDDGIHPTAQVQERMLDVVWPVLEPLLKPAAAGRVGETGT